MTISLAQRLQGGLWGLLVGDAAGVPYEFCLPDDLPPRELLEMEPPVGFARSYQGIEVGTWSDDGAQALALLSSLLRCDGLDAEDLGRCLVDWYERGEFAVDRLVFDVGIQTGEAIRLLMSGRPALSAGPKHEMANGNGSLMRVLPLALWHQGTDLALVEDAHTQSLVTHGHPRSQACCALYCLWARRTLEGVEDAWGAAVETLRALYDKDSPWFAELEWSIRPDDPPSGTGSGYVVDCLRSARWALAEPNYEQVIKAAISLGRDTDTTACVAGGIAGIRDGIDAIPSRWMETLRGKEWVLPWLERLLARHHGGLGNLGA
ncbi:MAG: ADP-ribosylglycohydrolase family protein [Myxococcales bacterium]|nr:ADP-ribosylglycohydrolase family protein [Myxococcales bacterium]MCB9644776.1 ADP-ribosylglycohydrolase family protein [Myxococcales bacterium]